MKPAKGIMPYAAKFVPCDDTGVTRSITAGAGQAGRHGAKFVPYAAIRCQIEKKAGQKPKAPLVPMP
jgi:hypothetical protein